MGKGKKKRKRSVSPVRFAPSVGGLSAEDCVSRGMVCHRAGQLDEAEALYRQALTLVPGHGDGLHLLGLLAHQRGRNEEAEELVGKAAALHPDRPAFFRSLGGISAALGKTQAAVAAYERARLLAPRDIDVCLELGGVHLGQARFRAAEPLFRRALELDSGSLRARNNLGFVLFHTGRTDEAESQLKTCIETDPSYPQAHHNLGDVYSATKNWSAAATCYQHAVEHGMALPDVWNKLANALQRLGLLREAVSCYRKALEQAPGDIAVLNNLGNALQAQGELSDALVCYEAAAEADPTNADTRNHLGNLYQEKGRIGDAVDCFRAAIRLQPEHAVAHNNLGNALHERGQLSDALVCYREATRLAPDYAEAHSNLALALQSIGMIKESLASYATALRLDPRHSGVHSNMLYASHYDETADGDTLLAQAAEWGRLHAPPGKGAQRPSRRARAPGDCLRIGYVSPDFRQHSVSYFFLPLLMAHDRRKVSVSCYAEVSNPDSITARIRSSCDHWCSTVGMSDTALAGKIRDDGIDVLVDLAGHTANNRLPVFAFAPAPVQVTWLGYPGTTGLETMDYRLTDDIADPVGRADDEHTERLLRMPDGFLCYEPPQSLPDVGSPPCETGGCVTFGSFNNGAKLNAGVATVWSRIVMRVPGSRLLLKSRQLGDPSAQSRVLSWFAANGIEADRIEFRHHTATTEEHLLSYNAVDIALDPFPYNGTTTTCEALCMGVPVVALRGDRHAARVGASILTRVGSTDLIAATADDYVEKAVALASSPERLAAFRSDIRSATMGSPLCDAPRFARTMEGILSGL